MWGYFSLNSQILEFVLLSNHSKNALHLIWNKLFPGIQKYFITFSFSKFSIRLTRSIITLGSVGLLYIPRAKKTTSDWRHCKSSVNPIDNNSRNFGISSLISTGTGLSPPDESVWWVRNGGRSNVLLRRIATPIAKNKC